MYSALTNEDWEILTTAFPKGWRLLAKSTKAMTRKFRGFANEESVLRSLLVHIAGGYSLRETSTRLKLANIADVSDVALMKRLKCSENWLKGLCQLMFQERGVNLIEENPKVRMRIVDATHVKEPGKTGSLWRVHYSLVLPELRCDYFKMTSDRGKGTGESFKQYPVEKGDCIIGDRGYSTSQGIEYLVSKGAHALLRINSQTLNFLDNNGLAFSLLPALQTIEPKGLSAEWDVSLVSGNKVIPGRICAIKKSKIATELSLKKLKRIGSKQGTQPRVKTIEMAKYLVLFTTLPKKDYPLSSVLEWYRYRWQIELVFKRLKSIAGLGHLPKHDESSSRAWLYGKLFTGLLAEKLISMAEIFSPWGYDEKEDEKHLA